MGVGWPAMVYIYIPCNSKSGINLMTFLKRPWNVNRDLLHHSRVLFKWCAWLTEYIHTLPVKSYQLFSLNWVPGRDLVVFFWLITATNNHLALRVHPPCWMVRMVQMLQVFIHFYCWWQVLLSVHFLIYSNLASNHEINDHLNSTGAGAGRTGPPLTIQNASTIGFKKKRC